MQVSIEQKLTEITIDQKLAALKEISDQKDEVDGMISDINMIHTLDIQGITIVSKAGQVWNFYVPTLQTETILKSLDAHLKARREELIARAKDLMR